MTAINPLIRFSPSVSPTSYESTYGSELTLGFQFALSESKQVSHLGIYYPSAGFTTSVTVNLWNDDPLSSPLISISIPAGTYSTVIDNFYWVPVPLTTLVGSPTGVRYMMGAVYSNNTSSGFTDPYVAVYPLVDLDLVEPSTTFNGGYAAVGDTYPYIPATSPGTASYFGPNISFKGKPTGQLWPLGVPDPLPVKSDPLMVWTNTPPSPSKLPFSATVGFEFQLGATRRVEELGIYATPVGFTSEHKLTLWNSSQTPLATATVSSGVHTTTDYFHWVPIDGPPGSYVTLPPGTYRVGAFYDVDNTGFSNDAFIEQVSISSIGVNPTVSANYIIGYSGPGDTYPSFAGDPSFRSFFGPNVRFKSTPTGQLWPIGQTINYYSATASATYNPVVQISNSSASRSLTITGMPTVITKIIVRVNFTKCGTSISSTGECQGTGAPFYDEIEMTLTGPNGQTIDLITNSTLSGGSSPGGKFTVVFDDAAPKAISQAIGVDGIFVPDSYRPSESFSPLLRIVGNGTWTLTASDSGSQDPLSLNEWNIMVIGPVLPE